MNKIPTLKKRFRKGRKPFYEVTCNCDAYQYPHRFGGGYCNGFFLVELFWQNGMCGDCRYKSFDDWSNCSTCQVINGREKIIECEQLQEFIRANEITYKKCKHFSS